MEQIIALPIAIPSWDRADCQGELLDLTRVLNSHLSFAQWLCCSEDQPQPPAAACDLMRSGDVSNSVIAPEGSVGNIMVN